MLHFVIRFSLRPRLPEKRTTLVSGTGKAFVHLYHIMEERARPRRLLHVPSMTSLERTPDGFYGDSHEPTYNAVSYTWGRFTAKDGPALDIRGITWSVPRIKSDHFSVESFHHVLKTVAGQNGLVWVDVACIDQENIDVKMDEIGKQADIFTQASQVYAWLSSQDIDEASICLEALDRFTTTLEQTEIEQFSFQFSDLGFPERIIPASLHLSGYLRSLFSDPWFSSLWTLQEACLCTEAQLLSKDAQVLRIRGRTTTIESATAACATIKLSLSAYAESHQVIEDLISLIDRSGLSYFSRNINNDRSPMFLYSAAYHRECYEPLDRVYGIMQVYGFKLGSSSKSGGKFTLAELEDQFGEALNHIAPMTAQMHIHTAPPAPGAAWRPSRSSMMPEVYYMSSQNNTMCSITRRGGNTFFTGNSCSLENLRSFWMKANAFNEVYHYNAKYGWQHYLIIIHLDATQKGAQEPATLPRQFDNSSEPAHSCPCQTCAKKPGERKDGLDRFLATLPDPIADYAVLLLGSGVIGRPIAGSEDGNIPPWKRGSNTFTVATRSGILVLKPESGRQAWRRVGILSWETGWGDLAPVHEMLWKNIDCEFH